MGSYDRLKEEICTKKRENISLIQRRKKRSKEIYSGADEEEVHLTIKVTPDCTGILCREE